MGNIAASPIEVDEEVRTDSASKLAHKLANTTLSEPTPSSPPIVPSSAASVPSPSPPLVHVHVKASTPQVVVQCSVCDESQVKSEFIRITSRCKHKDNICKQCVQNYLVNIVTGSGTFSDNFSIAKPPCPSRDCRESLEGHNVQTFLTKEQFSRWDTLVLREWSESQPEFRWCSSPTCGSGQFVDGGAASNSFFNCSQCKVSTCIKHRVPMHKGISCDEYDKTLALDEEALADWKAKNAKPCPKCKTDIEKNGGCDHMKCKKCKHEFCWSCSADFEEIRKQGNHHHNPTCKFYAPYSR